MNTPINRVVAGLLALASSGAALAASDSTVVLVHGAFADGSSWNRVIETLQARHIDVIAAQLPLTSLKDDVAATRRAIDRAPGKKVVLVGHSWGGTVITEAGNDARVKGLVYIAAFAPGDGQSTATLADSFPPPAGSADIAKTANGDLYLPAAAVARDFAPDVPTAQQSVMTVTQGPIRAAAFADKVGHAAWKEKPSWYLVSSQDRMINPDLERSMAKNIGATTRKVAASHVPMLSQPQAVADLITQAVRQVAAP